MENSQCLEVYSEEVLTTKPKKGYFTLENSTSLKEITYHSIEGLVIVDGDIILGYEDKIIKKDKETTEAIIIEPIRNRRWPNKTVFYSFDPSFPDKQRIDDAINHWESKTSMRFIQRTNEANYVHFVKADGCSSYVGMIGGKQEIRLADGCHWGIVVHEIAHAIGFWHEQSREDRNRFVTIHLENVISGTEHNFSQHINDGQDIGEYDYGSIMHYDKFAFSKNGKPTIEPTDPNAQIGQRKSLSQKDINAIAAIFSSINLAYNMQ
ncbi:M12 family metallopeptidase [Cytobacillus kochii]